MAKLEKLEVPNDNILTRARIQRITVQTLEKVGDQAGNDLGSGHDGGVYDQDRLQLHGLNHQSDETTRKIAFLSQV